MADHQQALNEAVIHYNGRWPEMLTSGVMYWNGQQIGLQEFLAAAINWNRSRS